MKSNYINHIYQDNFTLNPIASTIDWSDWLIFSLCIISLLVSRMINFEFLSNFFKRGPDYYTNNKISVFNLTLNFVLVSSFFLKYVISIYSPTHSFFNQNSLLTYLILFISISTIILIKFLTLLLLKTLFSAKASFTIYYHLKYYQFIGLLTLPIFILTYFIKAESKIYFIVLAFIIYCILIIIREVEIFLTALQEKISLLYIILYLCTLEILPLILLIKILIGLVLDFI
jgi:hypothetical protein